MLRNIRFLGKHNLVTIQKIPTRKKLFLHKRFFSSTKIPPKSPNVQKIGDANAKKLEDITNKNFKKAIIMLIIPIPFFIAGTIFVIFSLKKEWTEIDNRFDDKIDQMDLKEANGEPIKGLTPLTDALEEACKEYRENSPRKDIIASLKSDKTKIEKDLKEALEALKIQAEETLIRAKEEEATAKEARRGLEGLLAQGEKLYEERLEKAIRRIETEEKAKVEAKYAEKYEGEAKEKIEQMEKDFESKIAEAKEMIEGGITEKCAAEKETFEKELKEETFAKIVLVEKTAREEAEVRRNRLRELEGEMVRLEELLSSNIGELNNREIAAKVSEKIENITEAIKIGKPFESILNETISICSKEAQMTAFFQHLRDDLREGVLNSKQLKQRYEQNVQRSARQAVLAGRSPTAFRTALSFVFSRLYRPETVFVEGNKQEDILSRIGYYVSKNDVEKALEEIEKLEGFQRLVCSRWEGEAKKYMEVIQALNLLKAYWFKRCN